MKKSELYKKYFPIYLWIVGITVLVSVLILAIETTRGPWWQGLLYGGTIVAVFGAILYYGSQQFRPRAYAPQAPGPSELTVTLPSLPQRFVFNHRGFWLAIVGLVAAIYGIFWVNGISEVVALERQLVAVGVFLGLVALLLRLKRSDHRRAQLLVTRNPLRQFKLDATGVTVPIELLTDGALHRAVAEGQDHIALPWRDITRWEVHPQRGKAPAQHSLGLTGESARYAGLQGVVGILRIPELINQEATILAFVHQQNSLLPSLHF